MLTLSPEMMKAFNFKGLSCGGGTSDVAVPDFCQILHPLIVPSSAWCAPLVTEIK